MAQNAADFTEHNLVRDAVARARTRVQTHPMSDLADGEGNQYIDVVMEGGGVLGIALAGYTYVLEQAGLRFLGIAGTSAGAVNALLLAALGTPREAKSQKLVELVARMPMAEFLDGDHDARAFSEALQDDAGVLSLLWRGLQVRDNLQKDLGLHPGQKLETWLTEQLDAEGIRCLADLDRRLTLGATNPCRLRIERKDAGELPCAGELAVVAADVTTLRKVVLPRMAALYWPEPGKVSPAKLVRASMSIPFFFWPASSGACPQGEHARHAWEALTGYRGTLPQSVLFVDGGVISNFPISVFHQQERVPLAPTFGVKLGLDAGKPRALKHPSALLGAVADTARQALDQDFLTSNPDYRHLIGSIDTGRHHWLNFDLNRDDKVDLFARGATTAARFLETFDWQRYKDLRRLKAELRRASRALAEPH
jgi:NTE family protein